MTLERIILISAWIGSAAALVLFVPKRKRREAVLIFLAVQLLSWSLGLIYVEAGWIESPVREFTRATSVNFSFNYMLFPATGVFYTLMYPAQRTVVWRLIYTALFASAGTGFVYVIEICTDLFKNNMGTHYRTWITFFLGFYTARKYYEWFFRRTPSAAKGEAH